MTSTANLGEEFGERLESIVTNGFTTISIAIGVDLGLFDVMAKFTEHKTCQEIADAAGMKERYVREWLGVMSTARIVNLDDSGKKFLLLPHTVPYLTNNGSENASALYSSLLANLTKNAFEKVKDCFEQNGPDGTLYEDYTGKFDIVDKLSSPWMRNHLVDSFISLFPDLKSQLDKGINVIDIGCGMGASTHALAKAFPKSTFYGVDFEKVNIERAKEQAEIDGLKNCSFYDEDVIKLPRDWANRFQYVFMKNVFHDLAHPMECLKELKRLLVPEGVMSVIDMNAHTELQKNIPGMDVLYTASLLTCLPMSLGAGGMGLGAVCGWEKIEEILTAAEFEIIKSGITPMSHNFNYFFYCKMK